MTIDEAIEILTDQAKKGYHFPDQQRKEASRLGIEALKHCRDIHHMSYEDLHIYLSGETE